MENQCCLIIDFGLYKTRAICLPNDKSGEKELFFSPNGQTWTYTAMYKECTGENWNLVLDSAQFEKNYSFSHFQKKPSLMGEYEKEMTNVFFHKLIETLSRYNNEVQYDPLTHESNFVMYVFIPHIWNNIDGWSLENIVDNLYFSCIDQCEAPAHNEFVQNDPVLLPIYEDTPSYLLGIDFGDGETAASYYDYSGDQTAESGERLKHLNLAPSGTINKVYSALKKVRLINGKDEWRILMNPKELTGLDFNAYFKKKVCEMNSGEKKSIMEFWKIVFDAIVKNNDFVKYDTINHSRNFMLAVAGPSGWSDEDLYSYRTLMINAGVPADMIMRESDAAFNKWKTKTNGKNTLVIDYGSSTIDITAVNNNGAFSIPIPSPPGARKIEELIKDYIKNNNPNYIVACREIDDFILSQAIEYNLEAAILLNIREAKEQFYSYEEAEEMSIIFNNRQISKEMSGYLLEEYISKDELETIIRPYRKLVVSYFEQIQQSLIFEGFKPEYIILSGGASRMPFVKEDINRVFNSDGKAEVFHDKEQADFVVSDGLALTSIDYSIESGHRGDKFWKIKEKYDDYSEELREYNVKDDGTLELIGEPTLLGVKKDGKWGWINVEEVFEIPPLYDNGFVCCYNGYIFQIEKDGLFGVLNRRDGTVAISFEHAYLSHIYNTTFLSMNNNGLGGLIKPGNIRLTPTVYGFKKGAYGRYCEFVKWNSWGRKTEGRIDLETGKEYSL